MSNYSGFRDRIVVAIAAATVAQGCGGAVADSNDRLDTESSGTDQNGEPALIGTSEATVEEPQGCEDDTTWDERLLRAEGCSGGGGFCEPYETEWCLALEEAHAQLKLCAAPVDADECPPRVDMYDTTTCTAVHGDVGAQSNGQCCYAAIGMSCAVPGRPLRIDGVVQLPSVIAMKDGGEAHPEGLSSTDRRALTEAWCDDARYEHASIASFGQLARRLAALGAPRSLVSASHDAARDERDHAQRCFAIASRFAGRTLRARAMAVPDDPQPIDLPTLAVETIRDGCIGETVAALVALEQARVARDHDIRDALLRIADDESRHGELAWRIVAWAMAAGGQEVREAVEQTFAREIGGSEPLYETTRSATKLEAFGRLSASRAAAVTRKTLRDVVAPCAEALLSS